MPFGGQGLGADFSDSDNVVDPASPMMIDIPNPMVGDSASHVSYTGLPGPAYTVVINPNNNQTVLYDLQFGGNCGGTQHQRRQPPQLLPLHLRHARGRVLQRRDLVQLRGRDRSPEKSCDRGSASALLAASSMLLDALPRLRRVLSCLAETSDGDYETT